VVKTNGDVGWLAIVEHLLEGIDKAKHVAGIQAFAIDTWIAEKCIIRPEDQGISIKEV